MGQGTFSFRRWSVSLAVQQLFRLMWPHLLIFAFAAHCFGCPVSALTLVPDPAELVVGPSFRAGVHNF